MRKHLIKSFLALTCLVLVAVPLPVRAQSADVGLSISASPTTVARGGNVVVSALVTNNTSKKMRATVTLMSVSACGTETSLAYQRISLDAGRTVALTVLYPISADACQGMYSLTISADSGNGASGKSAPAAPSSATAYVMVQ